MREEMGKRRRREREAREMKSDRGEERRTEKAGIERRE